MATKDSKLTQARLKELLHYNPETGIFHCLSRRGQALSGDVAGTKTPDGRTIIAIDMLKYEASHLAWLYVHGELPTFRIYRKNKDRSDNRIANFFDPRLPIPKTVKVALTQERLKELFSYDESTGIFTNLTQRGQNVKVGASAGSSEKLGYLRVMVDQKRYLAHRLAWLYVYGEHPSQHIDHINGEPSDNRVCNLRLVSVSENMQNQRRAKVNNSSGFLGVSYRGNGVWRAKITTAGVRHSLGDFRSPESAHKSYVDAKRVMHPTCSI